MNRRKKPFTDPTQLGELNDEVWKMLAEGPEVIKEMNSDSPDTPPTSPGAVVDDEAGSKLPLS